MVPPLPPNDAERVVALRAHQILDSPPEPEFDELAQLARLREHPFNVVLMDVEMPELDGVDATRRLRQELPASAQPVVIALSAHAFIDQRERFFAAGMDSYLAKPIRVDELTTALIKASAKIRSR